MNYIIKKTVRNFSYYLGANGKWEGLITNAVTFKSRWDAEKQVSVLQDLNPSERFEVITTY